MQTVLITGGTGLIGQALTKMLVEKDYSVIILTRRKDAQQASSRVSYAEWDPVKQTIDLGAIQCADYIINLSGAGVAEKRWTEKRKKEIADSRVKSGEMLVKTLRENPHHVKALISISGIGWYGPDPSIPNPHPFTEDAPADKAFLGETCRRWEASLTPLKSLGIRLVICRAGIVLSNKGGAFVEFLRPVRFRLATILGNGKQVLSWIHEKDLCNIFMEAICNEKWSGVYNAVTPNPVNNKTLVLEMARKRNGSFFLPIWVPTFMLKLILGELSIEVLKSATVSTSKILGEGFQFSYPTLQSALNDLI